MKAVITVIGKDTVGILAKVSAVCAERNANIMDVTQSVMQDMFVMVMLADITNLNSEFTALAEDMKALGESLGLDIRVMHEDIFNSMHRI